MAGRAGRPSTASPAARRRAPGALSTRGVLLSGLAAAAALARAANARAGGADAVLAPSSALTDGSRAPGTIDLLAAPTAPTCAAVVPRFPAAAGNRPAVLRDGHPRAEAAPPPVGSPHPLVAAPRLDVLAMERRLPDGGVALRLDEARRARFQARLVDGRVLDARERPVDTTASRTLHAGPGFAIFTLTAAGELHIAPDERLGTLHHTSLAHGRALAAAGEIRIVDGVVHEVTGHAFPYAPSAEMTRQFVRHLEAHGIGGFAVPADLHRADGDRPAAADAAPDLLPMGLAMVATLAAIAASVHCTNASPEGTRVEADPTPADAKYPDTAAMLAQYVGEEKSGLLGLIPGIAYPSPAERARYRVGFRDGRVVDAQGVPLDTRAQASHRSPDSAMFVMLHDGALYIRAVQPELRHSSLLAEPRQRVAAAGEIRIHDGRVVSINRLSGHYQPTLEQLVQLKDELESHGIHDFIVDPAPYQARIEPERALARRLLRATSPLAVDACRLATMRGDGQDSPALPAVIADALGLPRKEALYPLLQELKARGLLTDDGRADAHTVAIVSMDVDADTRHRLAGALAAAQARRRALDALSPDAARMLRLNTRPDGRFDATDVGFDDPATDFTRAAACCRELREAGLLQDVPGAGPLQGRIADPRVIVAAHFDLAPRTAQEDDAIRRAASRTAPASLFGLLGATA